MLHANLFIEKGNQLTTELNLASTSQFKLFTFDAILKTKDKVSSDVIVLVFQLSAIHLMFHNFFGQHRERPLIWQLDYHPQYQFSVFAQGPTLQ